MSSPFAPFDAVFGNLPCIPTALDYNKIAVQLMLKAQNQRFRQDSPSGPIVIDPDSQTSTIFCPAFIGEALISNQSSINLVARRTSGSNASGTTFIIPPGNHVFQSPHAPFWVYNPDTVDSATITLTMQTPVD